MEDQTPSRNGKRKTEFARNGTSATNSTAKETLDNSCYVKRNGASFVLTAPSGRITTTKAKTKLSFDPSNSFDFASNRSKETLTSSNLKETLTNSNSTPRKLEETGCSSSLQALPLAKDENSGSNFKKRPKDALKSLITAPGKLEGNIILSSREFSCSASENSKQAVKYEGETPNSKQRAVPEVEIHVINDKLPRRSSTAYASRHSFGGSKLTPTSRQRGPKLSLATSRHRAEAASKLKAMENEEMQASRLAQARKDLWLDRQERAYCAWLNLVLMQPMKATDHLNSSSLTENRAESATGTPSGERDSFFVGSENENWHTPKRPRLRLSRAPSYDGSKSLEKFRSGSSQSVEACLQNVCSVSDLRQRLAIYLDASGLEEVLSTMVKLAKHVEDGRFKMKDECAILTDLGLREKAVQVLTNYNPPWLRIGLYIVLGHNTLVTKEKPSILCNGNFSDGGHVEEDPEFLKLVIEKHFFAHSGLSKSYSSNKLIDGLYRPGYYETLGKVILKRFFLFVLALDKAKCQSTLPIKNGIDGLDGGSPLLFCRNTAVKSSRQALQGFLSDVMHGEGDLLGRLATVGYQVSHIQTPLVEYDFHVANLIENLRDGIHLCRLVQILLGDTSVLMRVMVPCDYHKKNMHNCNLALQYLHEAGVPLRDEQGIDLTSEDVVLGDRERTLSLLWNIFVHLQMPLLIRKGQLSEEITKIRGPEDSNLVRSLNDVPTTIEMMLKWIQAICATYGEHVDNFKSSFVHGEPFFYLVDFYLPGYMPGTQYLKEAQVRDPLQLVATSATKVSAPKYRLVQEVIKRLYNIPEFLQTTDFNEGDPSCNERNVIIMLAFLSARLLEGNSMFGNLSYTQPNSMGSGNSEKRVPVEHTEQNHCRSQEQMAAIKIQSFYRSFIQRQHYVRIKLGQSKGTEQLSCMETQEKAVIQIQSWYRALTERRQFLRTKAAAIIIQSTARAWISAIHKRREERAATRIQSGYRAFIQRRQFLKLKEAVSDLQGIKKSWLPSKCQDGNARYLSMCFEIRKNSEEAATVIQSHYRGFAQRQQFLKMKSAVSHLQCAIRAWLAARHLKENGFLSTCSRVEDVTHVHIMKAQTAAIVIQSHIRGWLQRSRYVLLVASVRKIQLKYREYKHYMNKIKAAIKIQCAWKRAMIKSKFSSLRYAAIKIQSYWRGYLARKQLQKQKAAATMIESWYRTYKCRKQYKLFREALIKIQSAIRGRLILQAYLKYKDSVCKVQRCFRGWLVRKELQRCMENDAATVIQAAFKGWKERQRYSTKLRMVVRVQAIFRGVRVRRNLSQNDVVGCTSTDAQLFSKSTPQKTATEAAITIQQFYRGYVARSLSSRETREQIIKAPDVMVPEVFSGAQHVNHDLFNDVCISNLQKTRLEHILSKYIGLVKQRRYFLKVRHSVLKLQKWWRKVLVHRSHSAVVIQSHFRGWLSRKLFLRAKSSAILIQACWRGFLVRKNQVDTRHQLSNLRFRIKNSAVNVDDRLRLENRVTEALEVLLNHKTVSGILHTCATLDVATQHSKRCCERLVAAGAIDKLFQLIHSTNRSAPHEEVLKHALSVLSNIAYYPELAQLVVDTPGSINRIAEQLLRSKDEGFSKAAEVLKKLCAVKDGADAVRKLPAIIRRLKYLAQNLERKVEFERRSLARLPQKAPDATRKAGERRLREAVSQHRSMLHLLQCITGESSRRRSEVHKVTPRFDHALKRASGGPVELSRHDNKTRHPFQDFSNR